MIALRKSRRSIARSRFWRNDIQWFGTTGRPDLATDSHTLAWHLSGATHDEDDLYVMVNAYSEPLEFELQAPGLWRVVVDTSGSEPVALAGAGAVVPVGPVVVQARSIVVLTGRPT